MEDGGGEEAGRISTLQDKLDKIRSPKLQNQKETAVVLHAVEETLKSQKHGTSATAYFAALLALLGQAVPSNADGISNKELATSVVYLLDIVVCHVPAPLLKGKFGQILQCIAPILGNSDIEGPLMRSCIGCLETLLLAQDGTAWALTADAVSPRRAMAGLLMLAQDHRPKVRKRAQEAITHVLQRPPPSPSVDHPAADMCAESALRAVGDLMAASTAAGRKSKRDKRRGSEEHQPGMIHALQLVKTVAAASGGWPAKKMEGLCEILMQVSRSNNEWLNMTAFEIFEVIFASIADSAKLPNLMRVISELKPSQNDERLLPPWIAVLSRGYDVSAQVEPHETFAKLPDCFELVMSFLVSSSHSIRVSAAECLVSFMVNCIPSSVILNPSIDEEKVLEQLAGLVADLLTVKYQTAWLEIFQVVAAVFRSYRWRGPGVLDNVLLSMGNLRDNEAFAGKKEADAVLASAVAAFGPQATLAVLPLNLAKPQPGQPGRAWLLPILRDNVQSTSLAHFRAEMVPLSETMFQRVLDNGSAAKNMEIKIFETLVQQIWALLSGYCTLATDIPEAFDQNFAEMLANLLYKQPEMRTNICRGLQLLVETNQMLLESTMSDEEIQLQHRTSKDQARQSLAHLSTFAGNMLAVLFNVYSQTLPQHRGNILQCINVYLSITPSQDILETYNRVTTMLEADLKPPESHTLMDLVITLSIYIPRASFAHLFSLAARILPTDDAQLQKKAYKLLPRLATCAAGLEALQDRSREMQTLMLQTGESVLAPARRDRLAAMMVIVENLPDHDLHFVPAILSEVIIACKEANEKARTAAFDLLVAMARKMAKGGVISQSKIPHMEASAPEASASLEEFFTMVSAGLVGSTPHMVSASITALTRILYEYVQELSPAVTQDLVQTMDLFLTSKNREIVRSVLGFVKVTIISLPEDIVTARLPTLIPGLMSWSKEHKAHFRAKVKHIIERAMRRFGAPLIESCCPEEDKKLVQNIRKMRERRKRKDKDDQAPVPRAKRFDNEYDEAIYGSESDTASEEKGDETYITEAGDEPLDLLDRRSLANISHRKTNTKPAERRKGKTDADGKLVLMESEQEDEASAAEDGVGAYVEAVSGRNAVQRGRGGRLKFSNKRDVDVDMEVDEPPQGKVRFERNDRGRGSSRSNGRSRGGRGRGGIAKRVERRPLGGRGRGARAVRA